MSPVGETNAHGAGVGQTGPAIQQQVFHHPHAQQATALGASNSTDAEVHLAAKQYTMLLTSTWGMPKIGKDLCHCPGGIYGGGAAGTQKCLKIKMPVILFFKDKSALVVIASSYYIDNKRCKSK